MTDVELLNVYRWSLIEADAIRMQIERMEHIGAPDDAVSAQITGMPHGTNHPEAARRQAYDGYLSRLRDMIEDIVTQSHRFEDVMARLPVRERAVCRFYYADGLTDETIAEHMEMDTRTINVMRNKAIKFLAES